MDSNHPIHTQGYAPSQHVWMQALSQQMPSLALQLASKHRRGHLAHAASTLSIGPNNNAICLVLFNDGLRVLIRFAMPGLAGINIEKTRDEAAVMKYLARTTVIPIPTVYGTGTCSYGPYIVTQFVEGTLLSQRLEPSITNPHPDLERAYHCMAHVLLELSKPTFPTIGALVESSKDGRWTVSKRPLTPNTINLIEEQHIPPSSVPNRTFSSATEYFVDLANRYLNHLEHQRKQGLLDIADWKEKFIARCLFRRIARSLETDPGPYRLYCDDFSPANVCVLPDSKSPSTSTSTSGTSSSSSSSINSTINNKDFSVTAVPNWPHTSVLPNEYTYTLPWFLLFQSSSGWMQDLACYKSNHLPHVELFLSVLRACENKEILKGGMTSSQRLSVGMAESLENGMVWFVLACRKEWVFDDVYWAFVDGVWFGEFEGLEGRLGLLSPEERAVLEGVEREVVGLG